MPFSSRRPRGALLAVSAKPAPDGAGSPWRAPGFRALMAASGLGLTAASATYVAAPLAAVLVLDAGPGEVGLLGLLGTVAFLLIGLPAGAWVDRLPARRVLMVAEAVRGTLLLSVPAAWWAGVLTLGQLCAVVLCVGVASVFVDVAALSVLPRLVGPGALLAANSAMAGLTAAGNVAGRGLGGAVVQLLGAPLALLGSGLAHLGSAWAVRGLDTGGGSGPARGGDAAGAGVGSLWSRTAAGLRHVTGAPELRALAWTGALANLATSAVNTMLPLVFTRDLGLSGGALGVFWAVGGIGLFAGTRVARRLAGRFGHGRGIVLTDLWLAPTGLLVTALDEGAGLWAAGAGWFLFGARTGISNVLGVSLRQRLTDPGMQGRMNAVFRFLLTGASAVGAGLAAVLGSLWSPAAAVGAGGLVLCLSALPTALSPLRRRRTLPEGLPAS
ncbi:MFS transporter [Streptomyces sp. BI20]|uniref:MFS transporter n=1 Tax=Streptomyces sp. BI20 TaxID=3403460 RepID=UPI003C7504FB